VRYLISHEQAIEDVLTDYETGGVKLMEQLEKDHQDDKRRAHHELDKVMKTMGNEYRACRQEIVQGAQEMTTRPVRRVEKEWMQEQARMQKLVEEGIRLCR
jgi:hypothetical protein